MDQLRKQLFVSHALTLGMSTALIIIVVVVPTTILLKKQVNEATTHQQQSMSDRSRPIGHRLSLSTFISDFSTAGTTEPREKRVFTEELAD